MVRFSVNAAMTRAQLDHVLNVCDAVRDEVGMAQWPSTLRLARDEKKRELSMA